MRGAENTRKRDSCTDHRSAVSMQVPCSCELERGTETGKKEKNRRNWLKTERTRASPGSDAMYRRGGTTNHRANEQLEPFKVQLLCKCCNLLSLSAHRPAPAQVLLRTMGNGVFSCILEQGIRLLVTAEPEMLWAHAREQRTRPFSPVLNLSSIIPLL